MGGCSCFDQVVSTMRQLSSLNDGSWSPVVGSLEAIANYAKLFNKVTFQFILCQRKVQEFLSDFFKDYVKKSKPTNVSPCRLGCLNGGYSEK